MQWNASRSLFFRFVSISIILIFFIRCADYNSLQSANGRQAIIDQANNYLTAMLCDQAIDLVRPLYESAYVDNDIRMLYSSAYGCKGGLNFAAIIAAFKDISGSDIWSPLVKSNYTANANGRLIKLTALERAAEIVRQTATTPGSFEASLRTKDANVFMVFIHLSIITAILSPAGVASSSTGKKTISGFAGSVGPVERCRVTVAIATISDCLGYITASAALKKVKDSITEASGICGGACPITKDPAKCTAADEIVGTTLLTNIDSQWSS